VGVVFKQMTFPLRMFAPSAPKKDSLLGQYLVRIWSGFFQFGQEFMYK
jgi:hypothetical protein